MKYLFIPSFVVFAATSVLGPVIIDSAVASVEPQALCASSKMKAAGKSASDKLKCEAKAIQTTTNVDSECVTKAEGKLGDAFEKAELKSEGACIAAGDAAEIQGDIDAFVAGIVALVTAGGPFPSCTLEGGPCGTCGDGVCGPINGGLFCVSNGSVNDGTGCTSDTQCTAGEYCFSVNNSDSACGAPCGTPVPPVLDNPARVCAASKIKAAGKKSLGKIKCHAKAVKTSTNVDSECLTKAESKFGTAFENAEKKGGCPFTGDAGSVESKVDTFVNGTVTNQTVPVVPLPSCSTLGATCGTCGDGYCITHDPAPGCISAGSLGETPQFCTSDAQCARNSYCVKILDIPFPFPLPDLWACMAPCP